MSKKFILNQTRIDRIEDLDISTLTFEDISPHYGTGVALPKTTARSKAPTYRIGKGTNVGDIEISVWCEIVKALIERSGETELYEALFIYEQENGFERAAAEQHALELHAMRIFENPDWGDYDLFRKDYYPVEKRTMSTTVHCKTKDTPHEER